MGAQRSPQWKSLIYISVVLGRDQYGLLVPVDSLECDAVLMSLRAQKHYSHPDKSEQSQWGRVRKAKISPLQGEIKRHIKA